MIKLIQGDCLHEMSQISDKSIDLVLTDPPYGTTACKWDSVIPIEPMWNQLKRIIKTRGVIAFTTSQPFTTKLISSNMRMFRYCWIWDKLRGSGFNYARFQPMRQHEEIVIFYQKAPFYNSLGKKLKKPVTYSMAGTSSDSSRMTHSDSTRKVTTIYKKKKHL